MKTLIHAMLIAGALAAPVLSFAQEANVPLTRAEVRMQLAQVEQAGYSPSRNNLNYPADIQAAEARVSAQNVTTTQDSSVGGVATDGSSQLGARTSTVGTHSIYFGH